MTIDTLRADRLGCYGYQLAETPALDALARRGVLFEQALSTVPLTLPSHTSLLTGTVPPYHGVRSNGTFRAVGELVTLAERLRGLGFRTAAFISAFVLDSQFGLDQGFETYGDVPQRAMNLTGVYHERNALETAEAAIAWLESLAKDERFFLWVHAFEPHTPYTPRGGIPANMAGRPYDAEVAAADFGIGTLLDHLRDSKRIDETLVVFTADHGESLGEHGEETHGVFVYQGVLHVPLILSHPSLPHGKRVTEWVSLVDILPTILELLGEPPPDLPPPAHSLVDLIEGKTVAPRPLYFECFAPRFDHGWAPLMGVAQAGKKLIRAPRPELYDLVTDPTENSNLYSRQTGLAASLTRMVDALLAANERPAGFAAPGYALSDEGRAKLRDLGYLQGPASGAGPTSGVDPKDGIIWFAKRNDALRLYDQGRPGDALSKIREALVHDPDNGEYHSLAAGFLIKLDHPAKALDELGSALKHGWRTAGTFFNIGLCQEKLNRPSEAEQAYREGLDLDPKHLLTLLNLAGLLARLDRSEEACTVYERFLGLWQGDTRLGAQIREKVAQLRGG